MNEEEKIKIKEFCELSQILKIRNDEKDPVRVVIHSTKNKINNVLKKNDNFQKYIDELVVLTNHIHDSSREVMKHSNYNINFLELLFIAFTNQKEYEKIEVKEKDIQNIFTFFKKKGKKYSSVTYYYFDENVYKNSSKYYNQKYITYVQSLLMIYNNLQKGGTLILSLQWLVSKFIDILYLSTLLFEEVYLVGRGILVCKNFKEDITYINTLLNIIKNNCHFSIENKKNEKEIIQNIKKKIIIDLYFKKKLIENDNKILYLTYMYYNYLKYSYNFVNQREKIKEYQKNLTNQFTSIIKLYENKKEVYNINNENQVLYIFNEDYKILNNLIKENKLLKCLEVGCIVNYLSKIVYEKEDIYLTTIQPNKNKINHKRHIILNKTPLECYNQFFEKKEKFDFIFLNDKYNFDFVLFFFIYSDKILEKDGFIVINNSHLNSVSYCVKYIELNFKSYKKIGFHPTLTIFKKINEEERDALFFIPF